MPLNILVGSLGEELISTCKKYDVKVIAYNVLASGLLTGKYDEHSRFSARDRRFRLPLFSGSEFLKAIDQVQVIEKEAKKYALTVGQFSINWALNQPHVASAITGIKNTQQLEQNVRSVGE